MYLRYGNINININIVSKVIIGLISLFLSIIFAYYLQSDSKNRLESFGDYINYLFDKLYFMYIVVFMTFVFYTLFNFLLNNRATIHREIKTRGKTFIDNSLGPNFINRSITGGQLATNKLYDYTGRTLNYLRPKRAQIAQDYTVQPLYAQTEYPKSWIPGSLKNTNPFD
jgi:hypothetical protein